MLLTLLVYLVVGYFALIDHFSLPTIATLIALEVAIFSMICTVILRLIKHPERLLQTLSALIGVSLVVSLVSLPIFQALPPVVENEPIDPTLLKVNLLLLLWNLAAVSLIFKRAFEFSTGMAAFIAFNNFLLYELIRINFFLT